LHFCATWHFNARMAREPYKDPFEHLPKPRLFTEHSSDAEPVDKLAPAKKAERAKAALDKKSTSASSNGRTAPFEGVNLGSSPRAGTKGTRGRPKTVADSEPWKEAGMSRRTWYRKQQKDNK
jgi:hypothetical protein